jgi:hypothetical protein
MTKNVTKGIKDISFFHTIKIEETDKVCVTAKTIWKKLK